MLLCEIAETHLLKLFVVVFWGVFLVHASQKAHFDHLYSVVCDLTTGQT